MKLTVTAAFLFLFSISLSAQTKTFKWDEPICAFEGTYDSSKYSESQLKDTQELKQSIGTIALFTDATATSPDKIKDLSIEKLDKEFRKTREKLKNLNIVKSAYWEKMRQDKIRELDQSYELKWLTIQAYKDPSKLEQFDTAACCVNFYADALKKGGDYLYATWLKVNMDTRSKNANPARIKRIFDAQNASPDRMKYARVEVMRFGWWNCANRASFQVEPNERVDKEFRKLFIKVKEECDEP